MVFLQHHFSCGVLPSTTKYFLAMTATTAVYSSQLGRFPVEESTWLRAMADVGIRSASRLGDWAERIGGPRFHGRFGILLYHRIAELVPGLPPPTINVTPRKFREQLLGVLANGFVFWPLSKVLDWVAQGHAVPPYVTVLTIDDGFAGTYLHAWPVLRELRIPATVFLASAYLDQHEPFPFDHWGRRYAKLRCRRDVFAAQR